MNPAKNLASLSQLAVGMRDLERHLHGASRNVLDALAVALRDIAAVLAAWEYELLEIATASERRAGSTTDARAARLTAVARDGPEHVRHAMRRWDSIAHAYRDSLAPWLSGLQPRADARAPTAFFRAFLKQGRSTAKLMVEWTVKSASAGLKALRAGDQSNIKGVATRTEILRRGLVQALRALAEVQAKIAQIGDHPIPAGGIKIPVPEVRQGEDWSCGASSLQAVCGYFGVGPEEEWDIATSIGSDHRIGAHPFQLVRTARGYGLETEEINDQTDTTHVRALIDVGRPVLLMIQAWGDPNKFRDDADYAKVWTEGHWVVAIGYDAEGLFFEDPSLAGIRGYLSNEQLELRWRDTGPHNRYMPGFGIAMWKAGSSMPAYLARAQHID